MFTMVVGGVDGSEDGIVTCWVESCAGGRRMVSVAPNAPAELDAIPRIKPRAAGSRCGA